MDCFTLSCDRHDAVTKCTLFKADRQTYPKYEAIAKPKKHAQKVK